MSEHWPKYCSICGAYLAIDPSLPPDEARCPRCGSVIWFDSRSIEELDFLVPQAYVQELGPCTKEQAIGRMLKELVAADAISVDLSIDAYRALWDREELGSTALGRGGAVPHGKHPQLDRPVGCVARSTEGIDWGSLDGKPVHLVILLLSPAHAPGDHLRALENIARWFRASRAESP